VQKLAVKNVISFLLYQRDIVDTLMNKNVQEIDDFEWQQQIRLFWTGSEPQCKVLCGGWSVCQQNEYLGTTPRLTLTPLTNRYFVFISSTLREQSAILFNNSN
jgi:dynein heavy chain